MSKIEDAVAYLKDFKVERILNDDPHQKTVSLLGSLKGAPSIIIAERVPFNLPEEAETLILDLASASNIFKNDIYHLFNATPRPNVAFPSLKINLISPCTGTHIRKYSKQKKKFIRETPEMYASVTSPFIRNTPPSRIQWVYNILEGRAEKERLVYNDSDPNDGFLILPDLKWDQINLNNLYLVVLVHRRDIHSVRDLRKEHIPLLERIRDTVAEIVPKTYPGIHADELRLFVHYQPSYYHFHVHIAALSLSLNGMHVGNAILLDTIIDSISLYDDYYAKATISMVLGEDHGLYKEFEAAKVIT